MRGAFPHPAGDLAEPSGVGGLASELAGDENLSWSCGRGQVSGEVHRPPEDVAVLLDHLAYVGSYVSPGAPIGAVEPCDQGLGRPKSGPDVVSYEENGVAQSLDGAKAVAPPDLHRR